MTTVTIKAGEFTIIISTDTPLHPDLLDELCSRAAKLFADTQAGLPEDATEEG